MNNITLPNYSVENPHEWFLNAESEFLKASMSEKNKFILVIEALLRNNNIALEKLIFTETEFKTGYYKKLKNVLLKKPSIDLNFDYKKIATAHYQGFNRPPLNNKKTNFDLLDRNSCLLEESSINLNFTNKQINTGIIACKSLQDFDKISIINKTTNSDLPKNLSINLNLTNKKTDGLIISAEVDGVEKINITNPTSKTEKTSSGCKRCTQTDTVLDYEDNLANCPLKKLKLEVKINS